MILVTVGTTPFYRLVEMMDSIAGRIEEEVVMQIGHTDYRPINARHFDFVRQDVYRDLNRRARLVVCHGGVGSIISALREGKPVIAVPRIKDPAEMVGDDHQMETLAALAKEGLVKVARNELELEEALRSDLSTTGLEKDCRLTDYLKVYLSVLTK
jgi:beta-1,4-N-acetylglucosaminyltransferase